MAFRSENERRFASWLRRNNLTYEYEKIQFISNQGRTYTPDFYIHERKAVVEIKPLPLIQKEFCPWMRAVVDKDLKRYQSIFFILDMPRNTPEIYKAFDGYSEWIDDLNSAKALFEKVFELSSPLPPLRDQPNANLQRTFPRPTTQEERNQIQL